MQTRQMRIPRMIAVATLAAFGLVLTTMLPGNLGDPKEFGDVVAALPKLPAIHASVPTIPAPGVLPRFETGS